MWESLLKNKESVDSFKTTIKRWKPESCPCRLCNLFTEHRLLIEIEVKEDEDESITYGLSTKFRSIVGRVWMDWLLFPLKSGGLWVNWFTRISFHGGTEVWWQSVTRTCLFISFLVWFSLIQEKYSELGHAWF